VSARSQSGPASLALAVATSERWYAAACDRLGELLVDHANCEKKAASTALNLMFAYADDAALAARMSRLAREELRHFEQVEQLRAALDLPWLRLAPSRYAAGLRGAVRRHEPARLVDLLVCGALIEARSHERFVGLAARALPAAVREFYARLAVAEARHHTLYLRLAADRARTREEFEATCARLGELEAELVSSPDPQFRFHSGTPVNG
jgi:tRNA-(ms[2]io[6]A)-hydroxylase